MMVRRSKLTSFSGAASAECAQYRPEKFRLIQHISEQHTGSLLARGLGSSYGDAALNPDGIMHLTRLDRAIAFDHARGLFTAEAGISLADILDIVVPRGWMLPVIPGTRHVTLGGAIASNVHGKNHFKRGDFGRHVTQLSLRLADGSRAECSADKQADLFHATLAGYGLTGVIEEATLQLMPLRSASVLSTTHRVSHLDAMLDAFETARDEAEYMVGWIDHFGKDTALGRGVFSASMHMDASEGGADVSHFKLRQSRLSLPFTLPRITLNKYSMGLYNALRFRRFKETPTQHVEHFDAFFHPLDSLAHWPRLYGKRGFLQYQFLIPESENHRSQLKEILRDIQFADMFSYLAVIKYHGPSEGLLTFSQPGYSVALDFPNTPKIRAFLSLLSDDIIAMGGQIYLAKDHILTAPQAADMLKERLTNWQKITRRVDPDARFLSDMSRRLRLKFNPRETLL